MPQARVAKWIKALDLSSAEAEEFRLLALLSRSPEDIQALFVSMRDELATLKGNHRA